MRTINAQKIIGFILAVTISIVGVIVAQWHGMSFWRNMMDSVFAGACVSVFFELSSIWAWVYAPKTRQYEMMKYGATGFLVFGMIGATVGPFLHEQARIDAISNQSSETKEIISKTLGVVAGTVDAQNALAKQYQSKNYAGLSQQAGRHSNENVKSLIDLTKEAVKNNGKIEVIDGFEQFQKTWFPAILYPALYLMTLAALVSLREDETLAEERIPQVKDDAPHDADPAPQPVEDEIFYNTLNEEKKKYYQLCLRTCENIKNQVAIHGDQKKVAKEYGVTESQLSGWANVERVLNNSRKFPLLSTVISWAQRFEITDNEITEIIGNESWRSYKNRA